jgi:hypothetical protein
LRLLKFRYVADDDHLAGSRFPMARDDALNLLVHA